MQTFFRAVVGGKFAPLLALENQDTEIDALINSFNDAVTETADNTLDKHQPAKKHSVMENMLKLSYKRRELKERKNTTEGAKLYREANLKVRKDTRKAKETWIEEQCLGIEENLQKTTTACERTEKLETRENYHILKRQTEYCFELYTHNKNG